MGIIACVDADEDTRERMCRARMVNAYLLHPRTNQETPNLESNRLDTDSSEEMETKIRPFVKQVEDSSEQSSKKSDSLLISPGLISNAKKQVQIVSNIIEDLDVEEYNCHSLMHLPDFSQSINIVSQSIVPPEPSKIIITTQTEEESICSSSMLIPEFSTAPQVYNNPSMPSEPSKVAEQHKDPQSALTRTFIFEIYFFETCMDEVSSPGLPDVSRFVSSYASSPENSMAAHVFGKNHCFRENPPPLNPLTELLNDKGKLSHQDEVRISNTPHYIQELLKQNPNS